MDPLSVTASIVAVVSAAATVAKQLEILRTTLRDASSALCSLINEVSDLRIVLGACESAVNEILSSSEQSAPATPLADLVQVLDKTKGTLSELDAIASSCLAGPINDTERVRASKFKWIREKNNAKKLQERLRESKKDILVLLESHSVFAISGMQVAVEQISIAAEKFQTESSEKLDEIIRKLSVQLVHTEAVVSSNTLLHEKLGKLDNSGRNSLERTPSLPPYEAVDPNKQGALRVQASCYRRTCRPWCSCRCHIRRNIQTPGLMKGFIGSLFIGYSGVPVVTQPCNERQCRKRSTARFILSYQFPQWFWTRTLFASFIKNTISGPEMLIRVQATIPFASETYQHCLNGDAISLKRLFEGGAASPFDVDPDGVSLLHNALRFNHFQTCHLLISYGSDLYQEDHTGLSAFHYAWDAILLDPSNTNKKQALLELFPQDEGGLDERQFSRIHKCVLGLIGSDLQNELSISTSAIDDPDNVGRTPLYWAAHRGDFTCASLLLQFGANPTPRTGKSKMNSPLHAAACAGNEGVVRELLCHGAPVDIRGEYDMTPLLLAAGYNDGNGCVKLLLQHGADVNSEDSERRTPLLSATQNGMLSNTQILLAHGADIDRQCEDGWTSLASCIFWNTHASIRLLLDHNADHRILTDDGDTILHTAACYGDLETLTLLTSTQLPGLNPDHKNTAGKTAQEIADTRTGEGPEWHEAFKGLTLSIGKSDKAGTAGDHDHGFHNKDSSNPVEKRDPAAGDQATTKVIEIYDSDDSEPEIFEDAVESITSRPSEAH